MLPADVGETFEANYINTMDFTTVDQRVDGVYTVQYRGGEPHGERVEMRLSAPEEFRGPRSDGIIVAAIEPVGAGASDDVVFVNETLALAQPKRETDAIGGLDQSLVALDTCGLAYWQRYHICPKARVIGQESDGLRLEWNAGKRSKDLTGRFCQMLRRIYSFRG